MSKSFMLSSHNMPSCKKPVTSTSISHVSTLSKFVHSTMPGQNIQCINAPSKSVTCSTIKSKHVNSDVSVICKNTVNDVSDSVIACVSLSFAIFRTQRFHSTVLK